MPTIRSSSIAHDAGPDDLAGVDVEQTRCFEGRRLAQHQTTGSLMQFDVGGAAVEDSRLLPHLDREATP